MAKGRARSRKAGNREQGKGRADEALKGSGADVPLEPVLERIRSARNFDFRNYKRATLRRRIERRMSEREVRTMAEYVRLLDREPAEFDALLSGMLIKATSFFRDQEVWDALSRKILPQMLAEKRPAEEIRVWCAGCATGEEAFSIAIMMAETMGPAFQNQDVKIFESVDLQRRIYRKDGRRESRIGQERLVSLLEQDLADRRVDAGEMQVGAVDQFHRDVIQASRAPIIVATPEGSVLLWNRAATDLWGKGEHEAVGKKLAALGLPGVSSDLLIEKTAAVRIRAAQRLVGTRHRRCRAHRRAGKGLRLDDRLGGQDADGQPGGGSCRPSAQEWQWQTTS